MLMTIPGGELGRWFLLGGRGKCLSRSQDSSPFSELTDGGVGSNHVPKEEYRKLRDIRLDPVKEPQEEAAWEGLRDERWAGLSAARAPTRTCAGLSEHFAVKEESQESVGWSLERFHAS